MDGAVHLANRLGLALGHGQLPVALGVGHGLDGLRLALGLQDGLLLDGLGGQDQGLLFTFGACDRCLTDTVGLEYHGPPGALCLHLLVHGRHDVGRRVDPLDLDPYHPYAPFVGCIVEHLAQRHVDVVARREGLVEAHLADHVTQVGLCQFGDGHEEVGHVVDETLGVGRLVVDDRIHGDCHVVLGDHLLGRYVDDLLTHVDPDQRLDHRDDQLQSRVGCHLVLSELFDDAALEGPDDLDRRGGEHEQDEGNDH